MNINKYKQNRDKVTGNMKVELEIDVHSDVQRAVKWQVLRHVTEYHSNKWKYNKYVHLLGSWGVLDCGSQLTILIRRFVHQNMRIIVN